jgi:hypothetical protein
MMLQFCWADQGLLDSGNLGEQMKGPCQCARPELGTEQTKVRRDYE